MSVKITSVSLTDQITLTGGGGVPYLNGNVTDRMQAEIQCYVYWALENARLQFVSGDKTITFWNELDQRTFTGQGFVVGDTFDVSGTGSNDGSYTIADISEDGRTITTVESLVTENAGDASIYGTTPVEAIDLYFNLIKNGDTPYFESNIDSGVVQKFNFVSVDASDTLHTIYGTVGTKSRGWVTQQLSDETTGETQQVSCIGAGITDYKQYFTITHLFFIAPFYLSGQRTNFEDNTPPSYYFGENALKYVCRIDAKTDQYSPDIIHTATDSGKNGNGKWCDESSGGRLPEYYVDSITYTDNATSETLTELDINKTVDVEIVVKSQTGTMTGSMPYILQFFACPDDVTRYQNTPTRTLLENFCVDQKKTTVGGASGNGANYGTGYQVIKGLTSTLNDANTVTLNFQVVFGSDIIDYFESIEDQDGRQYAIVVKFQAASVTTTKGHDRVTALADFNTMAWDKTDTSLLQVTENGFVSYPYPDVSGVTGFGSIDAMEGEPCRVEFPFRVYNVPDGDGNTPTIKSVDFSILVVDSSDNEFELETKTIDCTGYTKYSNVQQIDFSETRGYNSYTDDPFNTVSIERDSGNDATGYKAYSAKCAFIARFEDWVSIAPSATFDDSGMAVFNPITKVTATQTQRWVDYIGLTGWDCVVRVSVTVTDTSNVDQIFQSELPITLTSDSDNWSGASGALTAVASYYDEAGTTEVKTILKEEKTLIFVEYTGDFPIDITTESGWFGWFRMLVTGQTGTESRFCSSEVNSESDSPWSAGPANLAADIDYASDNLRISIWNGMSPTTTTKIRISAYFDGTKYNESDSKFVFLHGIGATPITT